MKKLLKIALYLFVTFTLLFGGAVAYVIKNEDFIIQQFVAQTNKVIKTDIEVSKIDLDFLSSFPDVSIALHNALAFDAIPGSKDTLLQAEELYLAMDLLSVLKQDYQIHELIIENGKVNLKIDGEGRNNYSILDTKENKEDDSEVHFSLNSVVLKNVGVSYIDLRIKNNHLLHAQNVTAGLASNSEKVIISLSGDIEAKQIKIHGTPYLRDKQLTISTELHYAKQAEVLVIVPSQLNVAGAPFLVQGRYEFKDESLIDLSVESPESNIQTLLSIIPKEYASKFSKYKSEGMFYFNGNIKGRVDPGYAPQVSLDFGFDQASIYHPESGQKVENATFKGQYSNGTSRNDASSFVYLRDIKGTIGDNTFSGHLDISNFADPFLDFSVNGKLDLASVLQLYPLERVEETNGDVIADFSLRGKWQHLQDKNKTSEVDSKGTITFVGVGVKFKNQKVGLQNLSGTLRADKNRLAVEDLSGNIGESNFKLVGHCQNFLKFMLEDKESIHVDADLYSTYINLDELLLAGNANATTTENADYSLNLSPYVSFDFNSQIDSLQFRRLKGKDCLQNIHGKITLKNRFIRFKDLGATFADGSVNFSGAINGRRDGEIVIQSDGSLVGLSIKKGMHLFENFGQEFIRDEHLNGKLNADFLVNLPFDDKFDLNLKNLRATITTQITDGSLKNFEPMLELGEFVKTKKYGKYLKNDQFDDIQFSKLENTLTIKDEVITIPSMKIVSTLSEFTVKGTHSFDNVMDYDIEFPLVNYKKRDGDELSGIHQDEESKEFIIYLNISGTAENYVVEVDKKRTVKSAKEKVREEIKETFRKEDDTPDYLEIDTEDSTSTIDFDDL